MALDTFKRLKEALAILLARGSKLKHYTAIDWGKIGPLVEAFVRAKSDRQKDKIIKEIERVVQEEHWRQEMGRIKTKLIQESAHHKR